MIRTLNLDDGSIFTIDATLSAREVAIIGGDTSRACSLTAFIRGEQDVTWTDRVIWSMGQDHANVDRSCTLIRGWERVNVVVLDDLGYDRSTDWLAIATPLKDVVTPPWPNPSDLVLTEPRPVWQ